MRQIQIGFTIVELLVVITIIVVLLALLTPAMDKAIYRAEQVSCLANTKVQHAAQYQYAYDNARRFPERTGTQTPDYQRWPGNNSSPVDVLRDTYLRNLRSLICPIVAQVPSQSGYRVFQRNDWITTEQDASPENYVAGQSFALIGLTYGGWETNAAAVYTAYCWMAGFGQGITYSMSEGEPDTPKKLSDMGSGTTFITHRLDFWGGPNVHENMHGGRGDHQLGAQFEDYRGTDMPVLFADGHAIVHERSEIKVRMTVSNGTDLFMW